MHDVVLPEHAGLIHRVAWVPSASDSAPRACGADPQVGAYAVFWAECSPRPRADPHSIRVDAQVVACSPHTRG